MAGPGEMAAKLRVLLADDDPLVLAGLRTILSAADDLVIVGEAADGAAAVAAAGERRPAVVLMDIRMPGVDGIAATSQITSRPDPPQVIVLTTFQLDEYVLGALQALTDRERDVVAEVAQGRSNAEIAARLYMSEATVKAHVSRVLAKLGAANRVQIAIMARDAGLA